MARRCGRCGAKPPAAEARCRPNADNLLNANIETGRSAANVVTLDAPPMVRLGLTVRR
jgi:hypothetical protein